MKVLIIEDEEPAAERLKDLLIQLVPEIEFAEPIVSIRTAVNFLSTHPQLDLIFLDIHLADGSSFDIFNQVEIETPVIFITAYDEYALKAFKVNSIEYLLKPVKKDELANAIEKWKKIFGKKDELPDINALLMTLGKKENAYKKRFLVRYGEHIRTIETDDIAYFYTEEKNNFFRTKDNQNYPCDFQLDKLESLLDPHRFFRINRQFIINIEAIDQMFAFSKSRVKVVLRPPINLDTIVSTERSPHFKEWLGGDRE